MRVRSVTVGYGWSINLGNYESARLDLSITADVDEGENDGEVRADLLQRLKDEVRGAAVDAFKEDPIKRARRAAEDELKAARKNEDTPF